MTEAEMQHLWHMLQTFTANKIAGTELLSATVILLERNDQGVLMTTYAVPQQEPVK